MALTSWHCASFRRDLLRLARRAARFHNITTRQAFHSTPPRLAGSPLLNLSGLSISRESQHLSKEYRIPRTEFAPHLELIRTSEVEPFAANTSTSQPNEIKHPPSDQGNREASPRFDNSGTVAATTKYLIDELMTATSMVQELLREKSLLDSELARKNRDLLILSLFSASLVIALLFPDERGSLYRWMMGTREKELNPRMGVLNSLREKYGVERGQKASEGGGIGGFAQLGPAIVPEDHPVPSVPVSSPLPTPTASPSAANEERTHKEAVSPIFTKYFWTSESSR